jgi:glycosyltransferase involved in cell wall biosynthesis
VENGTAIFPQIDPGTDRTTHWRFGYFGQVTPYKGLAQLAQAFALIVEDERFSTCGAELSIHGANLHLNSQAFQGRLLASLARADGRVQLHGAYRREEVATIMQAVDWVVVPSVWWENAPLVIEEALACRRPVLCSGIGGMAEKVRHGRDGFHFRAGDHVDLARLIAAVCADPSVWQRLQSTMRPARDIDDVARQHLQLYSQTREKNPRFSFK